MMGMLPTWKGNLIVFSILIGFVLCYFFIQGFQAKKGFHTYVMEQSAILSEVIQRNAQNSMLSENVIMQIIHTFLNNTARFVSYLNTIEPFSSEELTAFAQEAGLAGIYIENQNGIQAEGPERWFPDLDQSCFSNKNDIQYLPNPHLYYLTMPDLETKTCILLGFTSQSVDHLKEQIALSRMLQTLSNMPGIHRVYIEQPNDHLLTSSPISLINLPNKQIAETRIPIGSEILVVQLDATYYFYLIHRLKNEFLVFSAILAVMGVFCSWLLYRYQSYFMLQIQSVERELAKEREDATLGRAASAIAHEIRNPLNAISMGLQRLKLELTELPDEYQELVSSMIQSVYRTNSIVSHLREFAQPITPVFEPMNIYHLLKQSLSLYQSQLKTRHIRITITDDSNDIVLCDSKLMASVFDNLIKNCIEAQPHGGYLFINFKRRKNALTLIFENKGCHHPPDKVNQLFEPYFTTKTRGTGLGLSLAQKIIQKHDGVLKAEVIQPDILRLSITLLLYE